MPSSSLAMKARSRIRIRPRSTRSTRWGADLTVRLSPGPLDQQVIDRPHLVLASIDASSLLEKKSDLPIQHTAVGQGGSTSHLGGAAERQPADPVADLGRCFGELGLDLLAALAEVAPALVVDRDRRLRAQQAEQLDRFAGAQRVAQRAGGREADAAEVDERGADVDPVGDLADAVVEDGVAGDPERAVLLPLPAQREPDHVADQRPAQRRAVAAGGGGDLDRRLALGAQLGLRPGREAAGVAAEPPRAGLGRDHGPGPRQQRPAGGVEVVVVVVVAEQHRVDRAQLLGGDRGLGQLGRAGAPAEAVLAAGGVEGRVGEQAPAAELDQHRGAADVGEPDVHVPTLCDRRVVPVAGRLAPTPMKERSEMNQSPNPEDAAKYGGRFLTEDAPAKDFPADGMSALDAMRLVDEELVLEGDPWRNLATFVTTWMEPEAQRIVAENLHRNFIDHAEYPISAEIEQRCIRMLADLYHAPGETTGCRTQGSSEAIMLGALSLKWKWKERREAAGQVDRQAEPRLRRRRPRGLGKVLPLLRRRTADRPPARGQVRDRARGRRAPRRREHDRRRRRPRHHLHRPRRRHPGDQRPAAADQGREGARRPAPRRRRQRRLRLALPLPALRVGLPARAGALDQRLRPQVRARLPGDRLARLPREGRPGRGPRLLRELPGQDRRHLHPQLLHRRLDGARPVLQLRPPRPRGLRPRDGGDERRTPRRWPGSWRRTATSS